MKPCMVYFIGAHATNAPASAAIVGRKAADLVRLDRIGLPVPRSLVLSAAAADRSENGLTDDVLTELDLALRWLEEQTGCTLGGRRPLTVSVRPSPVAAESGRHGAVLNAGLSEDAVTGLIRRTGDPWTAWNAYRRLVETFAVSVCGLDRHQFDRLAAEHLAGAGVASLRDLDAIALRQLAREAAALLNAGSRRPLPQDPFTQIVGVVEALLHAQDGMAVLIQEMVFGTCGSQSGSGVAYTKQPSTDDDEQWVDFAFGTAPDEAPADRSSSSGNEHLARRLPMVLDELRRMKQLLDADDAVQAFDFTVQERSVYLLDIRRRERVPRAAIPA